MKNIRILFLCVFAALLTQSCLKEAENHYLAIQHPDANVFYADHTSDSVAFLTFDNWKVRSLQDWIKLTTNDSYNFNFANQTLYRFSVKLSLEPNTTQKIRVGEVMVNSYDYTTYALFPQVGFLNITSPAPYVERWYNRQLPDSVSFTLADSSFVEHDSICFNVSGDWTLKYAEGADSSWTELSEDQGGAGKNNVRLTLQPNEATEPRETKLLLSCKGVENEIVVRQYAKKKSDE